jgi:hypothetical protein
MSAYDVRELHEEVDEIIFAEKSEGGKFVAYKVTNAMRGVSIVDGVNAFVLVRNKEHADNLRKALDKAEHLGWLK